MLRRMTFIFCVACAGCVLPAHGDTRAQVTAGRLTTVLEKADYVSFYFLSRTGTYSLSESRFKKEAGIKIYRKCGSNCRSYMSDVIEHFENSVSAKCLPGQQDVLVELGGIETILYSHSGRMIEFDGKCFFNEKGIGHVIKRSNFLFE